MALADRAVDRGGLDDIDDPERSPGPVGCCVWLTGLPSSGKTTLARLLAGQLARVGHQVELLDGDAVRGRLSRDLGFSKDERDENVRRVAWVAGRLARHGVVVIVALVSPYRSAREAARAEIPNFVEVFVDCASEECVRRDVKGLYRRALAGEIANFTGVSDPYEPPLDPEVTVRTDREPAEACVAAILAALEHRGYLRPARDPR
jgi:adenylyl-sulfate kinase